MAAEKTTHRLPVPTRKNISSHTLPTRTSSTLLPTFTAPPRKSPIHTPTNTPKPTHRSTAGPTPLPHNATFQARQGRAPLEDGEKGQRAHDPAIRPDPRQRRQVPALHRLRRVQHAQYLPQGRPHDVWR